MTTRHIETRQLLCLQQTIPDMTDHDGYTLLIHISARTHAYRTYTGKPVIIRHPSWRDGHGR
jgi:hypothetical protein